MSTRRMGAAAATAALALALTACGSDAGDSGSDDTASSGASGLKIGIKFDQPGLGLKKGSEYTGFDVDVAKYVAKELGTDAADITWVQAPSAQREALISNGQVDLVFATYSITDARKEKVSFGGPYFIAGQDLLVRADDTSITGPDSLDGKKLCSVTGSTSAQKVKDTYPGVQLQEFATYSECLPALANKGVDALTTDDTILAGFAAQPEYAGKFKVVGKPFSEEKYGVGLKKGDTALCEKVNAAISKMIRTARGRRRSTPTSARPATSPAPATRRRPPPAPDVRPRRGMPSAHAGGRHPSGSLTGRTPPHARDPRGVRRPRRVLDDGPAHLLLRHRLARARHGPRRDAGVAGRRAARARGVLRQHGAQHPAHPHPALLRAGRPLRAAGATGAH